MLSKDDVLFLVSDLYDSDASFREDLLTLIERNSSGMVGGGEEDSIAYIERVPQDVLELFLNTLSPDDRVALCSTSKTIRDRCIKYWRRVHGRSIPVMQHRGMGDGGYKTLTKTMDRTAEYVDSLTPAMAIDLEEVLDHNLTEDGRHNAKVLERFYDVESVIPFMLENTNANFGLAWQPFHVSVKIPAGPGLSQKWDTLPINTVAFFYVVRAKRRGPSKARVVAKVDYTEKKIYLYDTAKPIITIPRGLKITKRLIDKMSVLQDSTADYSARLQGPTLRKLPPRLMSRSDATVSRYPETLL